MESESPSHLHEVFPPLLPPACHRRPSCLHRALSSRDLWIINWRIVQGLTVLLTDHLTINEPGKWKMQHSGQTTQRWCHAWSSRWALSPSLRLSLSGPHCSTEHRQSGVPWAPSQWARSGTWAFSPKSPLSIFQFRNPTLALTVWQAGQEESRQWLEWGGGGGSSSGSQGRKRFHSWDFRRGWWSTAESQLPGSRALSSLGSCDPSRHQAGMTTRFCITDTQKPLTGSSHVTSLPTAPLGVYRATRGLPHWLGGKESARQCRSQSQEMWARSLGQQIPCRTKWQPTAVFLRSQCLHSRLISACQPLDKYLSASWSAPNPPHDDHLLSRPIIASDSTFSVGAKL